MCSAFSICSVEYGCRAGQMPRVKACGEGNEFACGWGIQLEELGGPARGGNQPEHPNDGLRNLQIRLRFLMFNFK